MIVPDLHDLNRPLAEVLGWPVPTYGSRYENVSVSIYAVSFRCRTCGSQVKDRYEHELMHRREHWINEVDRLFETVSILFGK